MNSLLKNDILRSSVRPKRSAEPDRQQRINALSNEILITRLQHNGFPETQPGREKECHLAIVMAATMIDMQEGE